MNVYNIWHFRPLWDVIRIRRGWSRALNSNPRRGLDICGSSSVNRLFWMAHIVRIEQLQTPFWHEKRRNLRRSCMRGIPLPGRTEVRWMPRVIGILSGSLVVFLVRDQLPPWSGAAVVHDPLTWSTDTIRIHHQGPWLLPTQCGIMDMIRWGRDPEEVMNILMEEMGVEEGLYTSLKDDLCGRENKGIFKVWQLLNDCLKETVTDLIGHFGLSTSAD